MIYCSTFTHVTEGDTMGRAEVLRTIKDSESEAERIRIDAAVDESEAISHARVTASEALSSGRQSADDEKAAAYGKKNRKSAAEVVLSAFRKA